MSDPRADALHAQLTEKLAKLTTSDEWTAYLTTMSRFHTYSSNNCLLILMQRPNATRVAGFQAWKSVGRSVVKGAKGIAILAPMAYKVKGEDGEPTKDESGNEVHGVRGFRVVHVFDVADTQGEPLPDVRPHLLEGDAPAMLWDAIAAQIHDAGFTIERGDCDGANGTTNFATRVVRVRDDVSSAQAAKTSAHELAHVLLHGDRDTTRDRNHNEVEAESVAYIVCAAQGVEADEYSLGYIAGWSGGNAAVVAETAARVLHAASAILAGIAARAVATPIKERAGSELI
jgi:N-terminal domain of anti-restriction factor ArdC/IrrE N-terminal-like domain